MKSFKQSQKLFVLAFFVITIVSVFSIAIAQDDTIPRYDNVDMIHGTDPLDTDITGMATNSTLGDVTSRSEEFYGSIVTLEGEVSEFVNSYIFALGEGAMLDNDQVLVINNSSEPFHPEIMKGTTVRITGRIMPSFDAVNDGVDSNYDSLFVDDGMMDSTNISGTDIDMNDMNHVDMGRYNIVQFAQRGYLPDQFSNYTIFEIVNRDNVEYLDNVQP